MRFMGTGYYAFSNFPYSNGSAEKNSSATVATVKKL